MNFKSLLLGSAMMMLAGSAFAAKAKDVPPMPMPMPMPMSDVSIVLVHGAWADGSSWAKVIPLLQAKGYNVVAVQNPLTSLADDVAATQRVIANQPGKVVLVGHSWGGTVITDAGGDDKVSALVYVASVAPSENEAFVDQVKNYPATPGLGEAKADSAGYLWLSQKGVEEDFAPDLAKADADVLFATQGPTAADDLNQKVTTAAWKTKMSYAIVADNDLMIQPQAEIDSATKIKATVTHVVSSHVPMLSHPDDVAAVIIQAAEAACKK